MPEYSFSPFECKQQQCAYKKIVECWNNSSSSVLIIGHGTKSGDWMLAYKPYHHKMIECPDVHLKASNETTRSYVFFRFQQKRPSVFNINQVSENNRLLHYQYLYMAYGLRKPRIDSLTATWHKEADEWMASNVGRGMRRKPEINYKI
jgi:hypothetical protein